VIGIAQLARTVSIDFKFPEHINLGLSALTRSTKEAALLLSGSSFRSMADEATPKSLALAPIHSAGLVAPMAISPLSISPNYSAMASPSIAGFPQTQPAGGLNKFDERIVQMRNAAVTGEQAVRSPPPPIVSIPLPRAD
jgi:hypothetical protein